MNDGFIEYQLLMIIEFIIFISIIIYIGMKLDKLQEKNEKEYKEYIERVNKEYEEWEESFKYWSLVENLGFISILSKKMERSLKNDNYINAFNTWIKLRDYINNFEIDHEKELIELSEDG